MSMFSGLGGLFSPGHVNAQINAPQGMQTGSSTPQYAGAVAQQNQDQAGYAQALQAWQQGRQPFYQGIQQGVQDAGAGQLADQYRDAMRQQSYGAARAGNLGGAADLQSQGNLQQQYATGLGNLQNQGYQASQAQQLSDAQTAQQWYQAFQSNPALQAQYQAELQGSQARQGVIPGQGQAAQQVYGNNSVGAGIASSGLSMGLSGAGNFVNTAASLGYFNPAQTQIGGGYQPAYGGQGLGVNGGFGSYAGPGLNAAGASMQGAGLGLANTYRGY